MNLIDFVETSRRVAATRSRKQKKKSAHLVTSLRRLRARR